MTETLLAPDQQATFGLVTPERLDEVIGMMLGLEQIEGPVIHRFGAGVYIRELFVKAAPSGSFIIGNYHKREHMNVMISGRVTRLMDDGTTVEYKAPLVFREGPGRKIGIVHEDMRWLNIFVTDETDVATLEEMLFDKGNVWKQNQNKIINEAWDKHAADREDYFKAIAELGFDHATVRAQSENLDDQIKMPVGDWRHIVAPSPIEGLGVFATSDILPMETIAPARLNGRRTPLGRYTNHSLNPNARMVARSNRDLDVVAISEIKGCRGGNPGDEITLDYRQAYNENLKEALCHLQSQ